MLLAKDIMTTHVICIHKDTPIFEAIDIMVTNGITGIPVVTDDSILVGILSEQDVLRLFHNYEEEKNKIVSDFMTQPVIHFEENESVKDICTCMMHNSIRRVPVTLDDKVVGLISRSDILKQIQNLHKINWAVTSKY
ncbi:MAG: CBS domain-containing protein [Sedimentisphaerales bacterium]|nr:CBS domain-containing protein [Sedimentisphaerales bacterium]